MARHYEKRPDSEAVKDFLPYKKYFRKTAKQIVKGMKTSNFIKKSFFCEIKGINLLLK